ncbi:MAG: hypothetical protein WD709_02510 [Gammaproteobacteria bacterium]
MSKYRLPSDARLEQLIRESFEHMPGPQMTRLDQIEKRLKPAMSRQPAGRKVNKTPWWIVLLLTGSFAAAAWWAGELFQSDSAVDKQTESHESSIFGGDGRTGAEGQPPASDETAPQQQQEPEYGRESPIIYQRESLQ